MDAVIVLAIAVIMLFSKEKSQDGEIVQQKPTSKLRVKLNENFIHDEDAFMEMAHQLGFRNDSI